MYKGNHGIKTWRLKWIKLSFLKNKERIKREEIGLTWEIGKAGLEDIISSKVKVKGEKEDFSIH